MTTQQKINEIGNQLREIYKTNEGPRMMEEMMQEFPNPRRVWNAPQSAKKKGGWGMMATSHPGGR